MPLSSPSLLRSPADRLITLPEGVPEFTLGWSVIHWAMTYLRHPNGPHAGQPWRFVPTQIRFLLWFYAVDAEGRWLFNRAVRRLAKGSGKSPFAALMALAEFCAPVRVRDFDPRAPGGVVGVRVALPLVQIAATAESQTANTMRMVRAFAPKGSRIVHDFHLEPGKTRYDMPPAGVLETITTSFKTAEGAETSFAVGDETEHSDRSNGGPEMIATLLDNLTKSGSRLVETCNAWIPGSGSVAQDTWDAWLAQEEGRTKSAARILYDARIAPPDTDLGDEESLMAALRLVYDDCWWQMLEPIRDRIWSPTAKPDDSRRKYLNQPTVRADSWTTPQAFGALARPDRVVADGEDVVLFFDGSKSRDATALVGCCMSDGHVFTVAVWEPDPAHDTGDVVPVAEVDLIVGRAFERWSVNAFFADVAEWEGFVKVTWPDRYGDRLKLWAVPSGKDPQSIAWDMRSHAYEFTLAAELTADEIMQKAFTHDGSAVLTRHVSNARSRPYKQVGYTVSKESRDSPKKIDAAVAMIGARMVRRLVLAGTEKPRSNSAAFY